MAKKTYRIKGAPKPPSKPVQIKPTDYHSMPKAQLYIEAKARGLAVDESMTRRDLITLLEGGSLDPKEVDYGNP